MRIKWTVTLRLFMAITAVFLIMFIERDPGFAMVGSSAKSDSQQFKQKMEIMVVLEKVYLDGEVSEEVVNESFISLQDFWAKYDQWQLIDATESTVIFRKNVDDISPLLKANGFFGVTSEGVLSIYNGKPGQSKIIQSFFQIDIKKLESKKQEELKTGIPVRTKNRYVEVLETFKPYSTAEKERN
jgi:forespore regulator of the sigma-K checkpoint